MKLRRPLALLITATGGAILFLMFLSSSTDNSQNIRSSLTKSCGDGSCEDDESRESCPSDCSTFSVDEGQGRMLQIIEEDPISPEALLVGNESQLPSESAQFESTSPSTTVQLESPSPSMTTQYESPSPSISPDREFGVARGAALSGSLTPSWSSGKDSSAPTILSFSPSLESRSDLTPTPAPEPSTSKSPTQTVISFFAIGDVPYSVQEECLLPYEFKKLPTSGHNAEFLVHLGDIVDDMPDPTTQEPRDCPEIMFQNITTVFANSPLRTFFVPGDNGWLDCLDADDAYTHWEKYLLPFNERDDLGWPDFRATVNRHSTRTELFSFFLDGVLFLGQSLPEEGKYGDPVNRNTLLVNNAVWTEENFINYSGQYKAVVVMGHNFEDEINSLYMQLFESIATHPFYGQPPILLLQGGASHRHEEAYRNITNVALIQTDSTVTPAAITVDPWSTSLGSVFQVDRRCYCSIGHHPTGLKQWDKESQCASECEEAQSQCQSLNGCSSPWTVC